MVFAVVVIACALLVGRLSGGRVANLGHLDLRYGVLVVLAVAVQLGGGLAGGTAYPLGLVVSVLLVALFLGLNRSVPGVVMVALGLMANALVIAANGAMPVSGWASGKAGVSTQDLLTGADARHELADEGTRLRVLGDVVPVLMPGRPEVVSPGDVLIAAGLAQLVVAGMRRSTPRGGRAS